MKVSSILVNLKGADILSAINDFLDVEGLELEEVKINNEICVKGRFKKVVNIKFEGAINDINVVDGKIIGNFSRLKVYKLGMFRIFRSLALKIGFDFVKVDGLVANKEKIEIDIKKLIKDFKFLNLEIEKVTINDEIVSVLVNNLEVNLGLLLNKDDKTKDEQEENKDISINTMDNNTSFCDNTEVENIESEDIVDVVLVEDVIDKQIGNNIFDESKEEVIENKKERKDYYDKGRDKTKDKLEDKLPKNAKVYSDYLFIVPDLLALIYRLLKDNRVPIKTKLSVSASIAYIVCPTDLIPSKIPVIGKVDDIAVLFFALNRLANDIPVEVIVENWSGKNEMILVLKNGLEYVSNFTGAKNVEKIYKIVEELSVL